MTLSAKAVAVRRFDLPAERVYEAWLDPALLGRWMFGAVIGLTVVVIRAWGGLPEGVMYSILLANALVPFINKVTQPRVFGVRRARVVAR